MKISKKVLSFVISLALIIGMIPVPAFALGSAQSLDYPSIELNEGVVISTEDNEGGPIFSFVPAVDGEYVFFAYDSDIDTRGYILDENMEVLAENDDFYGDHDFRVALSMTAGTQYYLVSTPYYNDDSGEYTVKITELVPATAIDIVAGSTLNAYVGQSFRLDIKFAPNNAIVQSVTWNSSNTDVVTVSEYGYVEILTAGTATITVTSENGLTDTCTITATEPATLIVGEPLPISIVDNEQQFIKFVPSESGVFCIYTSDVSEGYETAITVRDAYMNYLTESWDGFVDYEFEADETYYILTNYSGYTDSGSGTYNLNAIKRGQPTSISFDIGDEYSGYAGTSKLINVIYDPLYSFEESVIWHSNNPEIVSVDEYGEIYLNSIGVATITATSESGLVATCTVTVEGLDSIEINEEKSVVLDRGGAEYFYFTPDEDGYYAFYSYDNDRNPYGYILNSDMEEIAGDDDGAGDYNFRVRAWLEAGETYILKAEFWDSEAEGSFKVSVEKAKYVTALEIVSMPDKTEYIKEWVESINYYGLKLKATWSDGSVTDWKYLPNGDWVIDGADVSLDESNLEETGEVVLTCDEAAAITLHFTFIENPVESIEVVSGKVTCIENTNGYERDGVYFYNYDIPADITIKINYTDETSKTVRFYDDVDGYRFGWYSVQYETPWVLGDDNYLTVSYLGVETTLPVSIIASPVERIEINSAPTREYVYGDTTYGNLYSDGEYEFYPTDLSGLSFTVYYVDGTNKTFTYDDIDDYGNINGYGYELNYDGYNPETGDFPVEFMYMGKTANYTVVLKESTVSSIAVTKQPNRVEYGEAYLPDFIGMEITITYTDSTTKVVTLTEENVSLEYVDWSAELLYQVNVDGNILSITAYYDDEEIYFVADYLGAKCSIDGITFIEEKEIDSIELDNVSPNGDAMVVKLTYADETSETITADIAYIYEYGDSSVSGYAKTANGLLYYYIETFTDASGKVDAYRVYILGEEIIVEAPDVLIGDVNSDGAVNNLDRLVLARHLANWDDYGEEVINKDAADVNQDGAVNNLDRLILARHLANWEGYETLPMN